MASLAAACGTTPQPSPIALDGLYTLRIETDCAALPPDIRVRTYTAEIRGPNVHLSGATFWKHPIQGLLNHFSIGLTGTQVGLRIDSLTAPIIHAFVEETSPGIYFGIVGTGNGAVNREPSGVTIAGKFSVGVGWGADLLNDARHTGCALAGPSATFRFTPGAAPVGLPGVANTLTDVRVEGPASVAPGERAQLQAIGTWTDGSTRDITSEALWGHSFSPALDLVPPGGVVGRSIGEGTVTASVLVPNFFGNMRDSREIVVVPSGTVRINGLVTSGSPAQPIAGAMVSVESGATAGLSTTTDWDGRYALYGLAGESRIRVSKAGYEDQLRTVDGATHETLAVSLPLGSPIPDVSGRYTMTITADPTCDAPMPAPLDVRTYTAVVTQIGRQLDVALSGAPFFVVEGRGAGFPGQADPAEVTFRLDDNDHFGIGSNLDVVEALGGARVLFVLGDITASIAAGRLAGTLNGSLQFADRALPSNGFFWGAACVSDRHQVVFSR
jgi:hypothetical protein